MSDNDLIYIIGSLRNPAVPRISAAIRALGLEPFSDWYGGGPEADDCWKANELAMGRTYGQALRAPMAQNTFNLDYTHLKRCAGAVVVMSAGKSAHLEAGFVIGQGKPVWFLYPGEPGADERWDVMTAFAFTTGGDVCFNEADLLASLEVWRGKGTAGDTGVRTGVQEGNGHVLQPSAPADVNRPDAWRHNSRCGDPGVHGVEGDCAAWVRDRAPYTTNPSCYYCTSCKDFYDAHP